MMFQKVAPFAGVILFAVQAVQGTTTTSQKVRKVGRAALKDDGSMKMYASEKPLEALVPSLLDEAQKFSTSTSQVGDAQCIGSNTPDLIIISLTAGLPESYLSLLRRNRDMVVSSHNYQYCEYNHSLDTSRDAAWSKIVAIRHLISTQSKPVVWMDADAIFTQNKGFEDIINVPFETKDIVFTDDGKSAAAINTGVFVTKSTPWTQNFWASVWNDFPEAITDRLWENQAVLTYRKKFLAEFNSHAEIVSYKLMNNVGEYSGDFVAHPGGGHSSNKKYDRLEQILKNMLATSSN